MEEEISELNQLYLSILDEVGEITEENFPQKISKIFEYISNRVSKPEIPSEVDHIRIMSLHASKGLSSKMVIISSAIHQLISVVNQNSKQEEQRIELEEKRRLFYVDISRTKYRTNEYSGKLIISSFQQLVSADALRMNIPANPRNPYRSAYATPFINELGRDRPRILRCEEYLN